jgi:ribosomal 50S subunit-recycling heat shock protein
MRLDLFLKLSRLVKRRAIAREMCDAGRVLLNGHAAKPAREVKPGDVITLKYFTRIIEAEVLAIVAPAAGKKLPPTPFRITTDTRISETREE